MMLLPAALRCFKKRSEEFVTLNPAFSIVVAMDFWLYVDTVDVGLETGRI
jgi:hypothetical protein